MTAIEICCRSFTEKGVPDLPNRSSQVFEAPSVVKTSHYVLLREFEAGARTDEAHERLDKLGGPPRLRPVWHAVPGPTS